MKGTIHWVSAEHAVPVEVRLYDRLFNVEDPGGADWKEHINENSLEIINNALAEPGLKYSLPGDKFQFERQGYFCVDPDTKNGKLVFNRTVGLRDSWAKIQKNESN